MNIPSVDIIEMLEAESSLGLVYGTNLFRGREPSTPRNCVTVYDSGGYAPDLDLDGNNGYERPSVQVRIRNKDYDDGLELAQNIKDVLHGVSQETWNSTLYSVIYCTGSPALLSWDDNNNARLTMNFNIQRRE